MIACEQVSKRYGRVVAAADVTFVAANGEVTGLLGPNGAGKTTTLRTLIGLTRPDTGRAVVDGIDVASAPDAARARLGTLPEAAGLYDRLTVREHLEYSAELHGMPDHAIRAAVDDALAQFALTPLAERRAAHLSLGESRRVALARALVHRPANVILDEPTNGLDVLSARDVRRTVRRLAGAGAAVLFSSHVMPEVSAVCDRIVILAKGRVVAAASPGEILQMAGAPTLEDAFVRLIGSEEGLN